MCWKLDFFPTCEQQLPWIRCASPSRHRTFSLAVLFLLTVFVSDISQAAFSTTEMALALNRYLCSAVLPLITKCAPLFAGTDHRAIMIDSMLHTIYRLSRGRSLTKAQRDVIEECLMSLCKSVYIENSWLYTQQCEGFGLFVFHYSGDCFFFGLRYLRPSMLQHLLRRLVFDVPILNEYAKMPLKVLFCPLDPSEVQ